MDHYLVFDISNLLHRTFFANKREDEETVAGLAHHSALTTLNKYFREYKPSKVVMTFDRSSWRKAYTQDEELCVSGRVYKGNRRQKMSPADAEKYQKFLNHLNEFEELMRKQTSVICLGANMLEADDLVGGFVDMFGDDNRITIISADQDFIQLLRNENINLVDPATGKSRWGILKDDYEGDTEFFMFMKCIRGDAGDNVMSARPRLSKQKIRKAYEDAYAHANLMAETWSVGVPGSETFREFRVGDLMEENKLLMDLRAQPEAVKELIRNTIEEQMADPGRYSHFHFLKFLGRYEMKKIAESIDNFVPMLSR